MAKAKAVMTLMETRLIAVRDFSMRLLDEIVSSVEGFREEY